MSVGFSGNNATQGLSRTARNPPIDSWTIMGWFRFTSLANYNICISFGSLASGTYFQLMSNESNADALQTYVSGGSLASLIPGPSPPTLNQWYHLAMSVAGTGVGQVKGYVNGLLANSMDGSASPNNAKLFIGNNFDGTGSAGLEVCALKVFSRPLTVKEIAAEMWSAYALPATRPWLNCEAPCVKQNDTFDYSGLQNHWTSTGTITSQGFPPGVSFDRPRPRRRVKVPVAGASGITIASGLAINSDNTGHGNQSHLVYARNQQRWWLFNMNSNTALKVFCYVSSSNDLATATWTASTDSPVFPSSRAMTTNDRRNLGVAAFSNGSTDVAHISVGIGPLGVAQTLYTEHIRVTFTGAASITWDAAGWNEPSAGPITNPEARKGNCLGVSTPGKFIHEASSALGAAQLAYKRVSANGDTAATWTTGFGVAATIDSTMANSVNNYALAPLVSDTMLTVYEDGGAANPNCTGLRYAAAGSNADVGIGSSSQDVNDWCLCAVDLTHIYTFRPSSTTAILCRMFDGTVWSTPASTIPAFGGTTLKAGSGLFAAANANDLYLFAMDSAGNNAIYYVKGTNAKGTISFGSWTQLIAAGLAARNFISGCTWIWANQIGVIYTVVNGSNFDIEVKSLNVPPINRSPFRQAALDGLNPSGYLFADPLAC